MLSTFSPQEILPFPSLFSFILAIIPDLFLLLHSIVKDRPKLKGKFDEQVQAVVEYARTIEDFNKLIDPRTLARHCLGPEPSLYVLSALEREEKKRKLALYIGRPPSFFLFFFEFLVFFGAEMTSKFIKEMYKKIREKKNEPLSSIGQRKLRFTDKKKEKEREKEIVERGSSTPVLELEDSQAASLGVSIEEVARPLKKQKVGSKGKEKVGSSVWSDAEAAIDRAHELLTPGEMYTFSRDGELSCPQARAGNSSCLRPFFFFFFLIG